MQFSLDQFGEALRVRDEAGLPYIIIGGQAVNYWATRYLAAEPELSGFGPFTSKDIDFCGTRSDVMRMAAGLKLPPQFPHKKMMTAFAGAVPWFIRGHKSSVEMIRQVPGVTAEQIAKFAITHEYSGLQVRVIDVISLLICKLKLALTVDQSQRRDADHARILFLCTRAFLRETLAGAEAGVLPARGWLAAAERVMKLAESKTGRQAALQLGFNWREVLPETEITASLHSVLAQFKKLRLPQWWEKVSRARAIRKK